MACLDMYNSEHKTGRHRHQHHHHHHHHFAPSVSPRISFSNDFVDAQQALKQEMIRSSLRSESSPAAASSDFEFSVAANHSTMSGADELFFKGRMLPFKDVNTTSSSSQQRITTLREELLADDDNDDDVTFRTSKGSSSTTTRWKSFLGLRSARIGSSNSKKAEKSDDHGGPAIRPGLVMHDLQGAHVSNTSQDLLSEGDSSDCRDDVEIGM